MGNYQTAEASHILFLSFKKVPNKPLSSGGNFYLISLEIEASLKNISKKGVQSFSGFKN